MRVGAGAAKALAFGTMRSICRTLCAAVLAIMAACGDVPSPNDDATPAGLPLRISFTGTADPATGRFRIATDVNGPVAHPFPVDPPRQAVIGPIPEDRNGDPNTVLAGTAQLYGPTASVASGGVGYPAACNPASPQVLFSTVEVFSGFTEQLRNLYARITSMSGGQTFCSKDPVGTFGAYLNPNVGLYRYQPLDQGATSAIRRSLQWSMNLPDNGAFWFSGELWAEVIPQVPTITLPADNAVIRTGDPNAQVTFKWTKDPLLTGTNPEGFLVARPADGGAQLTILQCGPTTAPYDPATCTTTSYGPTVVTNGEISVLVPNFRWYRWSLRSAFILPGNSTSTLISPLVTTVGP